MHKMYSNGKEYGFYKTFYKNGKPHVDGFKENNHFIGSYKEYNDDDDGDSTKVIFGWQSIHPLAWALITSLSILIKKELDLFSSKVNQK